MNKKLKEHSRKLRHFCEEYSRRRNFLRPFAPNPKWWRAKIFIIGENPATPIGNRKDEFKSFDEYWQSLTVDPRKFQKVYEEKRLKKRKPKNTITTGNIGKLLEALKREGFKRRDCLVTNVCWVPARSLREVPNSRRTLGRAQLQELIEYCRPKALFCHGVEAQEFAETIVKGVKLFPRPFLKFGKRRGTLHGKPILVFGYHHLILKRPSSKGFKPDKDFPKIAKLMRKHIRSYK